MNKIRAAELYAEELDAEVHFIWFKEVVDTFANEFLTEEVKRDILRGLRRKSSKFKSFVFSNGRFASFDLDFGTHVRTFDIKG